MEPAEMPSAAERTVERDASGGWGDLIARERARGFSGLAGSRLHAALPVTQALVDDLLGPGPVAIGGWSVGVRLLEGARAGLEVTRSVLGLPVHARTTVTIENDSREPGRLVLRYPDSMLWRAIRGVATRLATLPAGVVFTREAVVLDIRAIADTHGWGDVPRCLEELRVEGPEDGLWILEVRARLPESSGEPGQSHSAGQSRGAPGQSQNAGQSGEQPGQSRTVGLSRIAPHQLLQHLVGTRLQLEIRMHDALANEVLGTARSEAARAPAVEHSRSHLADLLAARWPSAVRDLAVRFEAGHALVSADVEL